MLNFDIRRITISGVPAPFVLTSFIRTKVVEPLLRQPRHRLVRPQARTQAEARTQAQAEAQAHGLR